MVGARAIEARCVVRGAVAEVWRAWTTDDGVRGFFAPDSRIELGVGAPYELYFDPGEPDGQRGSEGCVVLAFQPERMLSFTWNAPPSLPEVRGQHTHVSVYLRPMGSQSTSVMLYHDGWGEGESWDASRAYFERVWQDVVLVRLMERFEHGPVDWGPMISGEEDS